MHVETVATRMADTGLSATVYAVGDLHAGDGGPSDAFAPAAGLYAHFLDHILPAPLWGLGDLAEAWQYPPQAIHACYGDLSADFGAGVDGNHDRRLYGYPHTRMAGHVLCAHGHQADPWNSRHRWVGRALAWLSHRLERLLGRDLDDWITSLPSTLTGGRLLSYLAKRMQPWEQRILDAHPTATVLLHGHDHRPRITQDPKARVIADPGSWTRGPYHCHAVRCTPGSVSLVRVSP